MTLATIPPEILSDILDYLKDDHYELLYQTGSKKLILLLSRSIKRINKVKSIYKSFMSIESIDRIDEEFHIFTNLKRIGLYRPILDDDVLLLPATIASISITLSYPVKSYPICSKIISKLPLSITDLSIDWLKIDGDYKFREGYRHIAVSKVTSNCMSNILSFPESATEIKCVDSNCKVVLNPYIEKLKMTTLIPGIYSNLQKLSCGILYYHQELPRTIESLHIDKFINDGFTDIEYFTNTNEIITKNYKNIFSLPMLSELSMTLPCGAVPILPKSIKKLTILLEFTTSDLKYGPDIVDLTINAGTISSILFPTSMTKFDCWFLDVWYLAANMPNLRNLRVDTKNTKVSMHDFKIYPSLEKLCTARSIHISNLPKSLLYLECTSLLGRADGDVYPQYLQSLNMNIGYPDQLEYIKRMMKYCTVNVYKTLDSAKKRLADLLEFAKLYHILDNKHTTRKLQIKIQWCDMINIDIVSIIKGSKRVTEQVINDAISNYLTYRELAYISKHM